MNCPECKTGILAVIETFPEGVTKYRHCRCRSCGENLITKEEFSSVDLKELRRIKSMQRRSRRAMKLAKAHAGNPFAGLLR